MLAEYKPSLRSPLSIVLFLFLVLTVAPPASAQPELEGTRPPSFAPLWETGISHASATASGTQANMVASIPEDASWEGLLTPTAFGVALLPAEYHGKLVLAGKIRAAGPLSADGVVLWDGTSFEALPPVGIVSAVTVWNDRIVVAGPFTAIGVPILAYNGTSWDTLGVANSRVRALREYGVALIAGGDFSTVGGAPAVRVAAYDGATWSALGSGPSGSSVNCLTVHAGVLVAGGSLSPSTVVSWNPSAGAWTSVGSGLTRSVTSLASDGVSLYAAATAALSTTLPAMARWDGQSWSSVGAGPASGSRAVTVWNGKIVATRGLGTPVSPNGLIQWDGVSVSTLAGDSIGVGSPGQVATSLGTWGSKLVATGGFFNNGSRLVPGIAVFDGIGWSTVLLPWQTGMTGPVMFDILELRQWAGQLVAAGFFPLVADEDHFVLTNRIASWDGSHWKPLGSGVSALGYVLGEYAGELVVGGNSLSIPGTGITRMGRWDGLSWKNLGPNGSTPDFLIAMQEFRGQLYVASSSGTGFSRWDGSAWSDVPGWNAGGNVGALAGSGDSLLIGGQFPGDGITMSPDVAFFDGGSFRTAGAGVGGTFAYVGAATDWNGRPVIGGSFSSSGLTPLANAAIWDGTGWQPLGSTAVRIDRFRVVNGELLASGEFRRSDQTVLQTLARFDGTEWRVLGSGSNSTLFDAHGGYVYQAGSGMVHGHVSHALARAPLAQLLSAPRPSPGSGAIELHASPNPAALATALSFRLPATGHVRLTMVDIAGRVVSTLADQDYPAGEHHATWSAAAAPGVYFARLEWTGAPPIVLRVVRL